MKKDYFFISLFFAVVVLFFYLFYKLMAPFFIPLAWAAIFGIIFNPLYEKLNNRFPHKSLNALLMTSLVVILIMAPAIYLGVAFVQEAAGMFDHFRTWVNEGRLDAMVNFHSWPLYGYLQDKLSPYVDLSQLDLKIIIENTLKSISKTALSQATNVLTNTGRFIFYYFLTIFFMYYFFRDGERLFNRIRGVIPMTPDNAAITINHLRQVIQSTMYGGLVVALIQGFLGGVLFAIFGLPSPVFWGAFMAFLAFIPILGPFLVYIPAGLILILTGSVWSGILLIAIGTLVVSQIDNFLRPLLVSGKTGMHTMMLFVSIMGGVNLFGLLGIVLGPVIAAIFVSLFDIFRMKLTEEDELVLELEGNGVALSEEADSDNETAENKES